MNLYGKNAAKITEQLIRSFERGDVSRPLSASWLKFGDRPIDHWSARNQFCARIFGCTDARGYRQWQKAGRQVRGGERARAWILAPKHKTVEDEETGEEKRILSGFIGVPVFDVTQTDGDPLPGDLERQDFIDGLPLIEVARAWGLKVVTEDTRVRAAYGYYCPGLGKIALGVENLATWLHELIHAADAKNGYDYNEDKADSEAVAELGGAVLAHLLGAHDAADDGGAWRYIQRQAQRAERDPAGLCWWILNRTIQAVDTILETADELALEPA